MEGKEGVVLSISNQMIDGKDRMLDEAQNIRLSIGSNVWGNTY